MTLYYFLCILLIYNNSVKQFILFCSSRMNIKFVQTPKRDSILSEGNQTATYWLKSKNNSMTHFVMKWIYGKYNIENWKFANYCKNWFSQFNFPNVCDNEWLQVTTSNTKRRVTTSDIKWQRVLQKVAMSDNEWQRVTLNENE